MFKKTGRNKRKNRAKDNTFNPKDVLGVCPNIVLEGIVGIMSMWENGEFRDVGDEEVNEKF